MLDWNDKWYLYKTTQRRHFTVLMNEIKKPSPTALRYQFPGSDHKTLLVYVIKRIPDTLLSVNNVTPAGCQGLPVCYHFHQSQQTHNPIEKGQTLTKKAATQKKRTTDEQNLEMIDKRLDAKQICEKCGFTKATLRRKLYELSGQRGQLINLTWIFGASIKTEFEVKKSGSLVLPRKVLEAQSYKVGSSFKIEFEDKRAVLNLI